ncbi:MAG: arginyltransferase [Gemmatales bacterium]|nr:arginyltransferase [Gemmatales bacterium]MDW7993505.1 arginyltransferase [Gemmatales bacterium]
MTTRYYGPLEPCSYLPEQTWRLEYELVSRLTPAEYQRRLEEGWRRFGHSLFRNRCPKCFACQSLRVLVEEFRPNRSQRRCAKANQGLTERRITLPSFSREKWELYQRFHAFQAEHKGWPEAEGYSRFAYIASFVDNPLPTEEWQYYRDGRLVGVGYVDVVPHGLSAIYFFYDPDYRRYSLGTWNILSLIEEARRRGMQYVYLGFYVRGCRSLEYKANFRPCEVRRPGGYWERLEECS